MKELNRDYRRTGRGGPAAVRKLVLPKTALTSIAALLFAWPGGVTVQAADRYIDYPIQPLASYEHKDTFNGLTVGVRPIREKAGLKTYFGTDLAAKGLLPVHVVLENESGEASFLLSTDDLAFAVGDDAEDMLASPDGAPGHRGKAATALGTTSAVLLSPVGLIAAGALLVKSSKIQHNMIKKELRSQTITSNERTSGFLFIPIDKKDRTQKVRLVIRARLIGGEPQDYEFAF